jgi:hypothetical protein
VLWPHVTEVLRRCSSLRSSEDFLPHFVSSLAFGNIPRTDGFPTAWTLPTQYMDKHACLTWDRSVRATKTHASDHAASYWRVTDLGKLIYRMTRNVVTGITQEASPGLLHHEMFN